MLLSGKNTFIPKLSFSYTDVRDVARAHVRAMTSPEAAGQRIIILNKVEWMETIAKALSEEFGPQGRVSLLFGPVVNKKYEHV